jgi:GrpB-like predicted nucleotidyltransferase (UPF0157 family)
LNKNCGRLVREAKRLISSLMGKRGIIVNHVGSYTIDGRKDAYEVIQNEN